MGTPAPAILIEVETGPRLLGSRTRLVAIPDGGELVDLLAGCPSSLVFSGLEHRLSGARGDLTGWAGRLAAKLAVADLLEIDADAALRTGVDVGLADLEILPDRAACPEGPGCTGPHPPALRPGGRFADLDGQWQVSISHTRSHALTLVARYSERSVQQA